MNCRRGEQLFAIVVISVICSFFVPDHLFSDEAKSTVRQVEEQVPVTLILQQDNDPSHGQSASLQKSVSSIMSAGPDNELRFGNYTYEAAPITVQAVVSTYARSFVYFPLPSLSVTSTITQATLSLYVWDWFPPGDHSLPFSLYLVTEPWSEDSLSWDTMPAYDPSFTSTTVISSSEGWYHWDVTPFVREWYAGTRPNYGVMVAAHPSPDAMGEWAVEAYGRRVVTQTLAPRLEIHYLRPPFRVYMPLVTARYALYPDLIVQWVEVGGSQARLCIANVGDAPVVDDFWVDLYIDPHPVPTAPNQVWHQLCDQGLVWGVEQDLAPGETLILEIGGDYFDRRRSHFEGTFTSDMQVYVQVDSANLETDYGGVLERHEALGEPYNNVYGPVVPTSSPYTGTMHLCRISVGPLR